VAAVFGLGFQDRKARFVRGRLDFDDYPLLETRNQTLFKVAQAFWRHIARHDNLFSVRHQIAVRIEKLFLELLFAADELNIVQKKKVDVPVAFPE
jgi:hypothetical protein